MGAGIQHVIKGRIVLREVSVNLDDALALNNISLEFNARKKIGIVGPSGSGKTTFLRLCQGFLRPNNGAMEIDGQNFRHLDINNYRRQVAMIDQKPMFFGATIEENLRKNNITIPKANKPVANYSSYVKTEKLIFISGQIPIADGNMLFTGKVNKDVEISSAVKAAELCMLNSFAILKDACLLYTSPSPRDRTRSRMPSSA